jgi:hypothetical protein
VRKKELFGLIDRVRAPIPAGFLLDPARDCDGALERRHRRPSGSRHGAESRFMLPLQQPEQEIVPSGALSACFDAALGFEIADDIEREAPDDRHVLGAVPGAIARQIVLELDVE